MVCDWGWCDGVVSGWRWSGSHGWLPVCVAHSVWIVPGSRRAGDGVVMARVAFYGGPWADTVREVDPPRLRMVVPVPRLGGPGDVWVPGPLGPASAAPLQFVYELRESPVGRVKAYYPARSRLGVPG